MSAPALNPQREPVRHFQVADTLVPDRAAELWRRRQDLCGLAVEVLIRRGWQRRSAWRAAGRMLEDELWAVLNEPLE